MSARAQIKRLAAPLFRRAIGRSAALRFAVRHGRLLVLLYHRILPDGAAPDPIVPSLPVSLFRRHVETLLHTGDIVPVSELIESPRQQQRPRFALTFDDDHDGYVATVLPALRALGVSATFFLSGRALHGLPPYWWTSVERSLRTRGLEFTRDTLGLGGARTVEDLAAALERSGQAAQLVGRLPSVNELSMTAADIRALTDAGMTIGFHTLHHPILTMQSGPALETALVDGRRELAAAAGATVDLLAYPHGRANAAVADAAEQAHYVAAFASGGRPITATSDAFLLDRWEPGRLETDELSAHLAMRLLRPPTPPRAMRRKRPRPTEVPTAVNG
jgi:peptidoglycan/xylan/chitin deacetylase (PgdA/CDA1 family)